MIKLRFILLFLIQFLTTTSYSQNAAIKHFTTDNGLPSNNVFYVFFDSRGYLWVSTDKGISLYNGISFRNFTTYDGLPDNEVFGLNEDKEGRVWISTFKGVLCYYKDNVFHTASNTPWLRVSNNAPSYYGRFRNQYDGTVITEAADGSSLLIISGNKIRMMDLSMVAAKPIIEESYRPISSRKINDNCYQLYYNRISYLVDTLCNIIKVKSNSDTSLRASCNSSQEEYLSSPLGIYSLDDKLLAGRKILHFNKFASRSVYFDSSGNSFIASSYGLLYNKDAIFLKNNYLTAIDHDNLGNIWVGTRENGIFCISKNFESIYTSRINNKIIASKTVGNITYLVSAKGDLYTLKDDILQPSYIKGIEPDDDIVFDKTNTCITKQGDIFSFQDKNILYKHRSDKVFKKIPVIHDSNVLGPPTKRVSGTDSIFYVSLRGSICIIKAADLLKAHSFLASKLPLYASPNSGRIYYSALNTNDNTFWFSKVNEVLFVKNNIVQKESRLSNHTFRQFDFYNDYLVGSTDGNNLIIYDTKTGMLDSLPNANCIWQSIAKIDDNTAVINTNSYYRILKLFPPDKKGKPRFDVRPIESPFAPDQADFIFGDSTIFYFIKNGLLSGFPYKILAKTTPSPKPLFLSLKTDKKMYAIRPVIVIPYSESNPVRILIDNVSFSDKNLITQYSISENNEDHWNAITGNEINLNAIGYGKFTIKLRSKTIASMFSEPATLVLYVSKPFWVKWWFIVLAIILLIIVLSAIIRLFIWRTVRKKQLEHETQMKFQQAEYKALNALMNPHFIFNSLNSIQSLINKNKNQSANQYLVIFSKLIRQNMANVSKGLISLDQELQLVENYLNLEKMRFKNLVDFAIDVDENVEMDDIRIPPLLIQPLVENAIIHGLLPKQSPEGYLRIHVYEIEDELIIDVIDNGIGIDQSLKEKNAQHESYGILNLNRRLEHFRQFQKTAVKLNIIEMKDESGIVIGTKATLRITFDI